MPATASLPQTLTPYDISADCDVDCDVTLSICRNLPSFTLIDARDTNAAKQLNPCPLSQLVARRRKSPEQFPIVLLQPLGHLSVY
jgi:hypothetical protein